MNILVAFLSSPTDSQLGMSIDVIELTSAVLSNSASELFFVLSV
jgi:hypothetical protein